MPTRDSSSCRPASRAAVPAGRASSPWPESPAALQKQERPIPRRAAQRTRTYTPAAVSVSGPIASLGLPARIRFRKPALAGNSLRLRAADLDREDLGVGRAPVTGARPAQERDRPRLGERVRELEVVG